MWVASAVTMRFMFYEGCDYGAEYTTSCSRAVASWSMAMAQWLVFVRRLLAMCHPNILLTILAQYMLFQKHTWLLVVVQKLAHDGQHDS